MDLINNLTNMPFSEKNNTSVGYCGTIPMSGFIQLVILIKEGLNNRSNVLELGCGALTLGVPLIDYLDSGCYYGIDPNEHLRKSTMSYDNVNKLIKEKSAIFESVDCLYPLKASNKKFDYVFAHSVFSHTSTYQFELFLENISKFINFDSKIILSLRLAEGNKFGNNGSQIVNFDNWEYPGNSYYSRSHLINKSFEKNYKIEFREDLTEFYTKYRPSEFHDWIILTKKTNFISV